MWKFSFFALSNFTFKIRQTFSEGGNKMLFKFLQSFPLFCYTHRRTLKICNKHLKSFWMFIGKRQKSEKREIWNCK